jgi:hypothetical protein
LYPNAQEIQASLFIVFAKAALAKTNHMAKSRFQRWRNRLHVTLMGRAVNTAKGGTYRDKENVWQFHFHSNTAYACKHDCMYVCVCMLFSIFYINGVIWFHGFYNYLKTCFTNLDIYHSINVYILDVTDIL